MKRFAFYFDQTRCMGCNACSVACKDWQGINPGPVRWRKQETYETNESVGGIFYSLSMSCNHCQEPACLAACPVGAINKREDGIVLVSRDACQGLKLCIDACPFSATHIADDKQEPKEQQIYTSFDHPMQKCTACYDRLDQGLKPICVDACPAFALDCGDYYDLIDKYPGCQQITFDKFRYAYKESKDTKPSLLIKPRKNLEIIKSIN